MDCFRGGRGCGLPRARFVESCTFTVRHAGGSPPLLLPKRDKFYLRNKTVGTDFEVVPLACDVVQSCGGTGPLSASSRGGAMNRAGNEDHSLGAIRLPA